MTTENGWKKKKKEDAVLLDLLALGRVGSSGCLLDALLDGLLGLLVGHAVEVDEQEQVRGKETTAEQSRSLGTSAATHVGKVGPVGVSKVGVGAEVDGKQINDELGDLHRGQITLPPDLGASSRAEIVVVHEDVNSQVQGNRHPRL